MALNFNDELERLLNPSNDMGGGAGPRDAAAIAKLIMGGGSASLEGQQLFGQPVGNELAAANDMGPGVLMRPGAERTDIKLPGVPLAAAPTKAPLSRNLQSILDSADQIATSLGSKNVRGDLVTSTLLPNPYGPGSYDPQDKEQTAQVQAQGKKVAEMDRSQQMLSSLSANPVFAKLPQAGQSEIVKGLLERMGVTQSEEKKAFAKAKGAAEGEIAGGKGIKGKLDELLSVQDATKLGVPYGTTKREAASKGLTGMSPAQQNTITEMGRARVVVGHLIEVANKLKVKYSPQPGVANRMGAYITNNLAALAQNDEDLAEYSRLKNALLAVVSRTVGGERGQSTEKDVGRAEGATPDFQGAISKGKLPDTIKVVDRMGPALLELLDELEESAYKGIDRRAAQGGAPAGKVIMIDSKGRKGYVPESQVEEALKNGYKKG
jgi:hypothetical protein